MNSSPSRSERVVELENVTFAYGSGNPILHIGRFEVHRGEKLFIYGPSGSGKTTLLGLLAGVLPPQKGKLHVLGQDYFALSASKRDAFRGAHIGYIFQMFNLVPYLSVKGNILLPLELGTHRAIRDRNARLLEVAKALGIEPLLERRVTELSVGQQQRVAAARALIGRPEILIADEPTSALDTEHREAFLKLLFAESEKNGAAVIFVSHDRQLQPLFDRAVSLREINQ
jgi:putative ABC transport system ATP-binding protein